MLLIIVGQKCEIFNFRLEIKEIFSNFKYSNKFAFKIKISSFALVFFKYLLYNKTKNDECFENNFFHFPRGLRFCTQLNCMRRKIVNKEVENLKITNT